MDRATLSAYDSDAAGYARDWHDQPPPTDLHDVVARFFIPRGRTADIGCGAGREVAWLAAHGFVVQGFDASEGLLAEARRRYPHCAFSHAALPDLAGLATGQFDNVLCETVIMHLAHDEIAPAARRLFDLVAPGGVLYLSWRVTADRDQRDARGRLYSAFDAAAIRQQVASAEMCLDQEVTSASSGKTIHRMVARKSGANPI